MSELIYNADNAPMKQMSLFDSFMRKPKPADENRKTNEKEKTPEVKTADRIEHKQEKVQVHFERKVSSFDEEEDKPKNDFKDLINSGDFAFGAVAEGSKKKRKMEIEDDEDLPRISAQKMEEEPAYEENFNESSGSGDKPARRRGRAASSAKGKKAPEQPKRATMGQMEVENTIEEFTDSTPEWATPQGCRDKNGRKPDHPNYDPTTLYVPPEAFKSFTETMKQYWKIKSENFDKIILFKLGKFYEMFYQDALVGNKNLDLKWMGSKMHVGFPEKCLDKYAHEFVQLGLKIVIVEQLETPDQMKERMAKQRGAGKKTEKTLQRGVTQVHTKGTIVSFVDQNQYLPNYLIAVSKHNSLIGYSLLEMSTNLIMVGYSDSLESFKTVLFQTRPVELLYDPDNLSLEIVQMVKQNWLQMVLTRLPNRDNLWHPMNARSQVENLVNSGVFNMPAIFDSLEKVGGEHEKLILATLSGMFRYLKNCLKFDYIMSAVRFNFYEKEGSAMTMVMDSQALQHLEIFETPLGEKDSLFCKIDRTHTKFGKRLLRRWMMQPLLDPLKINQRLDAVEDLEAISIDRNRVAEVFSKLPDLDKIVNRLYHYSVKAIAERAVYFEDVSGARLREFRELIEHLNKSWHALEMLRKHKDKFKSNRLIKLLTLDRSSSGQNSEAQNEEDEQTATGLLPSVREHLAQFDQYIKWEDNVPKPQKGLVQTYDMLQDELSLVKEKLQKYLDSIRMATGIPGLKYVHTKQRYEIQIPEQLEKKRLPDMIFTSKRSGFSRYVTEQTRKLVSDVEYVEQQIKEQMGLFVGYFFEEFRKNQKIWEKYIAVVGEIDCLVALSIISQQMGGVRPEFVEKGFDIKQAKHPCLNAGDVIANDINLDSKIMLLTGPNMGGKSTLLRTACLTVILAQMGCFVPAEKYECEVIDRIFTRIGASDKLQEGKSTFFIEMEETLSILTHGSEKSLAIIDELGRGTSTFDGMAIAYSVLIDLIQRVQCRCLFATHYHSLTKEFENNPAVRLKMMDYILADERIVFLYKLKDGRAEQSFGLNVAQVVRISAPIIQLASKRVKMMEKEIEQKDKLRRMKQALAYISR